MEKPKKVADMSVEELKEEALALHETIIVDKRYSSSNLRLFADVLIEINKRSIVYWEVNRLEFSK